jgi:hypothetical protein
MIDDSDRGEVYVKLEFTTRYSIDQPYGACRRSMPGSKIAGSAAPGDHDRQGRRRGGAVTEGVYSPRSVPLL